MVLKIIFGVLIGSAVGYLIHLAARPVGGGCPITCNPYNSVLFGAFMGLVLALGWSR